MDAIFQCARGNLQVCWWHCMFLDLLYNKNCLITTTRADLFAFLCRREKVSPCICFHREGLYQAGLRAHGWIDSPGCRLIRIDRLPRLQATLDWQTRKAPGSWIDGPPSSKLMYSELMDRQTAQDCPSSRLIWIDRLSQLQAHLDWQTAQAPGSIDLTDCPGSRLIWIDRLLGGAFIVFHGDLLNHVVVYQYVCRHPLWCIRKIIVSFSDLRHAVLVAQVCTHRECSNKVIWD